jgi:NADH-quinone oxidoreductase subunit F
MKIVVGQGSCGIASGARKTEEALVGLLKEGGFGKVKVRKTGCVGNCYLEPVVDIYDDDKNLSARYVRVSPDKAAVIVDEHVAKGNVAKDLLIDEQDEKFLSKQKRIVLRNAGYIDPEDIGEYIAAGGYEGLAKALGGMSPDDVIEEIKLSGLRGRGGAGFPTWFKWNAAKNNRSDKKYMVCNADEGDPGAFMDRSVLEGDPHSLLEGMTIGGYAIGAGEGVVYVRAEYPLAIARLEIAIEQARDKGFLGKNIMGSGFDFDIRIKAGAGAFV